MNFPPYSAAIFNTLSYLRLIFISAFVPLSILSLPPPLLPLNRVHLSCAAQWIWISSSCKFFFPTIAYMCTLRLCVYMTHWLDANNMFAYPKVPFFSRRSLLIHDAPWFMHFMLLPVLLFGQPVLAAVYYIVLLKIRKCKCRPSQWDAKERKEGRNKKKYITDGDLAVVGVFLFIFILFPRCREIKIHRGGGTECVREY